ncbi:MAG TPA: ATP-binding protein [Caulobacterales bacterium]|nr:ATP-binding protein [Caulobacterales bacterium]
MRHIAPVIEAAPLLLDHERPSPSLPSRRARELGALAELRLANTWARLASCALIAFLAAAATGTIAPFVWLAGLLPVLFVEHGIYLRLRAQCQRDAPPRRLIWPAAWILLQTAYVGVMAVMLWFAKYAHGETLAVILMLASLGNAAATLRGSTLLALSAALPTIALLVILPLLDYLLGQFLNPLDLIPVVGAALFVSFGANLWSSLRASDEAQARAEVAAMRERQAAAAAAAAKSEAIRRMQDELRTPMTALISAAEHLRRAAVSPEARMHIGALAQAGEVLRLVLEDLSDLDRLENGQLKIDPRPCDPRELVRDVIGAFRAAAHDKRLELFLDIAPDVPPQVELDGARVRQVLFNLLANAVKYTSHGGVRVRLQAQAGDTPERVRLGFVVADTGAGMSRSQIALIFSGRARGESSAGLGLAISLRLARLMGGRLAVKSEVGEGSVFSLVLEAPLIARSAAA